MGEGHSQMEANTTRPHPDALYFGNALTLGLYPTQKNNVRHLDKLGHWES
jgi:hypothetical protein